MVKPIELGSLYFNNKAVSAGATYNGEQISFREVVPEKGIFFIKWKGLYVADRCVCTNVSWEDLDKQGYIFGRPVRIDGTPYLCRSLKVGAEKGAPNEWDSLLDAFGEDDDLWHWENQYFWGQETSLKYASSRAYRGFASARSWLSFTASYRLPNFGFRPALEPLPSEPLISDTLIGRSIKIYGKDRPIVGHLVGYSDYDLEITIDNSLPENCSWIRQTKDTIFIDREAVDYLCEEG